MTKRPAFQFYPSDWRKDSGLRLCSIAARGLWVELMCIAHEGDEYGKLKQNGRGFSHKTLGKLVGLSPQTCLKLLKELEENRVFSRDDDGTIYSRRMVRDEEIRNIRAESGIKGGNPNLLGNLVKQNGKQKPTPSSSSSTSSSSSNTSSNEEVGAPKKTYLLDDEFWAEMRRHYPNIDVDAESRKMDAWLLARPGRKKTRQFVINWLNKVEVPLSPAKVEEVEQW